MPVANLFPSRWVQRRHKTGFASYAANAVFTWCKTLLTPEGLAHVLAMLCFGVQVVCIDLFLVRYCSWWVLLTLFVDVPLFIHCAWFWRVDNAHRAAPTQWFTYSWIHAAKVVVLFCRVMPRLPSVFSGEAVQILGGSIDKTYFQELYSPTMLANLLLITPVFYALLMFRSSKAIFGSLSKRVTVDLIMHYDMLWHVVIDMVDQVDMFYYSRLVEWVGSEALLRHRSQLVLIQTVVPFLLFSSIILQAQAFPGVVSDRWTIPEEQSSVPEEHQEQMERVRSNTAAPRAWTHRLALVPALPPLAPRVSTSGPSNLASRRPEFSSGNAAGALQLPVPSPVEGDGASSVPAPELPVRQVTFAANEASSARTLTNGLDDSTELMHETRSTRHEVHRERCLQYERIRQRKLQGVINLIQRQSIILARKRSAMISIFLVDIPFLAVRIWLWALLEHSYFPGLGVKNGICIVLNVMQYTLVAIASQESFAKIKVDLAAYIARFHSAGLREEAGRDSPMAAASPGVATTPSEAGDADTPRLQGSPSHEQTSAQAARVHQKAMRRVSRETVRHSGFCAYFWPLILAFWAGFVIAKGEAFVVFIVEWIQEPDKTMTPFV